MLAVFFKNKTKKKLCNIVFPLAWVSCIFVLFFGVLIFLPLHYFLFLFLTCFSFFSLSSTWVAGVRMFCLSYAGYDGMALDCLFPLRHYDVFLRGSIIYVVVSCVVVLRPDLVYTVLIVGTPSLERPS